MRHKSATGHSSDGSVRAALPSLVAGDSRCGKTAVTVQLATLQLPLIPPPLIGSPPQYAYLSLIHI